MKPKYVYFQLTNHLSTCHTTQNEAIMDPKVRTPFYFSGLLPAHPVPSTMLRYCHLPTPITHTSLPSLAHLARLWNEAHKPSLAVTRVPSSVWRAKQCKLTPLAKISRMVMTPGSAGQCLTGRISASFIWQKIITSFRTISRDISLQQVRALLSLPFAQLSAKETKTVFMKDFHTQRLLKMHVFTQNLWLERKRCGQCIPMTSRKRGSCCCVTR